MQRLLNKDGVRGVPSVVLLCEEKCHSSFEIKSYLCWKICIAWLYLEAQGCLSV